MQHGHSAAQVAVPIVCAADDPFRYRSQLWLVALPHYQHLKDWGMLEATLMGVLVAIVKLADMAAITVGLGLACFIGLLLVQAPGWDVAAPDLAGVIREDAHAGD